MMNRIETAIREGRCVIAIGGRALSNPEVLAELRRRQVPCVHLGGEPVNPVSALDAGNLAPALNVQGGIVVLVEPEAATDGRALGTLGKLIKAGSNKPKIFVAARAFNPFAMPIELRLLKVEQIKSRAKDFISALPVDGPTVVAVQAAVPAKKKRKESPYTAPRALFIGREEETSTLQGWLSEDGGPIVVTGPPAVGKRWLVEHALSTFEGTRLPDLTFGTGVGADTLLARIASAGHAVEDNRLHDALQKQDGRPCPAELAALAVETLSSDALADHAWVIHGITSLMERRRSHFLREGRLEMTLSAILQAQLKVRVIFTATRVPELYSAAALENTRVLALEGLLSDTLPALFTANHAPECPEEHFGPIGDRTLGHPMAARYLALTAMEDGDIEELLEQPRFLKLDAITDTQPMLRHIKRRIEKLDPSARKSLSVAALLRDPGSPDELRVLGLDRNRRLQLLSQGLLEQTPVDHGRRYYVHTLVAQHLEYRDVYDFGTMESLGRHLQDRARDLRNKEDYRTSLPLDQEGNRLLTEARRERSCVQLPYPDMDATVENILSLIRRRSARLDLARQRTNEALKAEKYNPELLLAHAELRILEKSSAEMITGVFTHVHEQCPTPSGFLVEAEHHLSSRSRGKAVSAIERGIEAFPANGRLRRRMAGICLEQNRTEDAITHLQAAVEAEPLMPDTHGLLGEAHTRQGTAGWAPALEALDEALRLDPTNPRNQVRKATLQREQGLAAEPDQRQALLAQAEETVNAALAIDKGHPFAQALLAAITLDLGGEVNRAESLIKKAIKRKETSFNLVQYARVLVRKQAFDDVERLLAKAIKKEPSNHAAFAAQAEFWEGQGQIFHAFEAIKAAKERSPKDSAARLAYEQELQRLGGLIESGKASEMMKAAGHEQSTAPVLPTATGGPRRDAGKTTIRRRKKGEKDASPEEAAEAAPAEDAAEAAPADDAAEAAPADDAAEATEDTPEAVEETVEAAPEEAPAENAAEDTPEAVEETVEAAPENAPAEDAPAEDAPAEDAAEAAPAEDPAETVEETVEAAPEEAPAEDAPAEDAPAEDAAQGTPEAVETASTDTAEPVITEETPVPESNAPNS